MVAVTITVLGFWDLKKFGYKLCKIYIMFVYYNVNDV